MAKPDYFLYGSELSLYTGKARCYLRKKGVHFETRSTLHPRFAAAVRAIGHSYQPILETASGEFVQDTTRIIDFVEARHPEPSAYPSGPCQRLVALLMELYGDEGLLKPAMHYRWNFPAENDAFLSEEFARAISPTEIPIPNGDDPHIAGRKRWEAVAGFMRGGTVPALGVTKTSAPVIEQGYEDLLERLDAHFDAHPYLLGGRPCIGDFGLSAPLHAHLGRDPYPSRLMKERASRVFRWVERMTVADSGTAEFPGLRHDFAPDDAIPETLLPVLELMARDYVPELLGIFAAVEAWLVQHPETQAGDRVPGSSSGMGTQGPFGTHRTWLRGVPIDLAVRHYSIWMAQRPIDFYRRLEPEERTRADPLIDAAGLRALFELQPRMRIERPGLAEIFA